MKQWVFNKSILLKYWLVQDLKQNLNICFKENLTEDVAEFVVWDAMKVVIREQIIFLSSKEKEEKQHTINTLQEKIQKLEKLH